MKPISSTIQYLIGGLALIFGFLGLWSGLTGGRGLPLAERLVQREAGAFAPVVLEAKAALVYEPDTGRTLFARNEREPLPIASLTKVMTALAASQLLPDSTIIPLSRRHYRLKDLTALTLVSSSNQGAVALAAAAQETGRDLVAAMNAEAKFLGLSQTTFANSTGLDLPNGQAGSRSSASDMAQLFTHILAVRPELLTETKFEEIEAPTAEGLRHRFQNTNEIVRQLPGLLASKTGFTDTAAGSLIIAFDRGLNQPIIVVILGSTETGRFSDARRLVEATIESFLTPA